MNIMDNILLEALSEMDDFDSSYEDDGDCIDMVMGTDNEDIIDD